MITYLDIFNIIVYTVLLWVLTQQQNKSKNFKILIKNLMSELDGTASILTELENELTLKDKQLSLDKQEHLNKIQKLTKTLTQQDEVFDLKLQNKDKEIVSITKQIEVEKKIARKEALKKSRAIMRGQATEHLAPYVMEGVNPKDCRFIGNPIDYIVFDGLSDVTDKIAKDIKQIVLVDIKTGTSNLTTVQRRIRDAINDKRISFQVVNPDKEEKQDADKSIL
jgi:predicted Holliday junction resolvase-like endonuclease